MLTLPKIVERAAVPYVGVTERVTLPFDDRIAPILSDLFTRMKGLGIAPDGPVFFKHDVIAMPDLVMQFGVPVAQADVLTAAGDPHLSAGVLPAGRYAEVTYFGHYDDLMDVNAVLVGWSKECDLTFDVAERADGDHFACRLEVYHNSPEEEPDPAKWETTVTIRLRD